MNFTKAKSFIVNYLKDRLPANLHYHGIHHSLDVCKAAHRIGKSENQSQTNIYLLQTAALYHDAGFAVRYINNEELGAELAEKTLPNFDFSATQIQEICSMILMTNIKAIPKTKMEKILCDADYDYLGRPDFHAIADNLYLELQENGFNYSQIEWDTIQLKFLMKHNYYTESAKKEREELKQKYLEEIRQRIHSKK